MSVGVQLGMSVMAAAEVAEVAAPIQDTGDTASTVNGHFATLAACIQVHLKNYAVMKIPVVLNLLTNNNVTKIPVFGVGYGTVPKYVIQLDLVSGQNLQDRPLIIYPQTNV